MTLQEEHAELQGKYLALVNKYSDAAEKYLALANSYYTQSENFRALLDKYERLEKLVKLAPASEGAPLRRVGVDDFFLKR